MFDKSLNLRAYINFLKQAVITFRELEVPIW